MNDEIKCSPVVHEFGQSFESEEEAIKAEITALEERRKQFNKVALRLERNTLESPPQSLTRARLKDAVLWDKNLASVQEALSAAWKRDSEVAITIRVPGYSDVSLSLSSHEAIDFLIARKERALAILKTYGVEPALHERN